MRKLVVAVLLLTPVLAAAQGSPLDGTWKVNTDKSQMPKKPDKYVLENGMYSCETCVPAFKVKADGTDQPVSGHPYFDTLAVKVIDDHNLEQTSKKGGKDVGGEKDMISSDGNTLTADWFYVPDNGQKVTGKSVSKRVGKTPSSGNMLTGSWRAEKLEDMNDSGLLFTFKSNGDELSFSTPTGASYTAKLGGGDAPYKGDPGTTSVSIKQLNDRTVEETDKRDGKVISVAKMSVSSDGKTMTIDVEDKLHGTTSKWIAEKQS